jgi:hypothetical protein
MQDNYDTNHCIDALHEYILTNSTMENGAYMRGAID